jgi:hypothetical protein
MLLKLCRRLLQREDLRDSAEALGAALAEEQARAHLDELGRADEPEYDAGVVVASDPGHWVDCLNDGGLPHVAHVHSCAETRVDFRRVVEHADVGLEDEGGLDRSHRITVRAHHSAPVADKGIRTAQI